MRICVTTIVSANYLAYAKVLGASVREHAPDAEFRVLVVDRKTPQIAEIARALPFGVVWAEELGLADFERIAYQFDILELNTGLKPTLLKKLLGEGFEAVIYWDPDIRLYAPPTPVVDALGPASIVLTPHMLAPMMDGRRPSDFDIMRSGIFNLGFVAVRGDATGLAMLDWWEGMCLGFGFNDPSAGVFVDQKFVDLVPAFFDSVAVLKHRGCNVAYWNLHERPLADASDGLRAGGDRLVFFHFSGVDARRPDVLSKYQNRHVLADGGVLQRLVTGYCEALRAAGHFDYLPIAYTFGVLSDGRPINGLMRRALLAVAPTEARPFDASCELQRKLARAGVAPSGRTAAAVPRAARITALTFDPRDRLVRLVNGLVRVAGRVMGPARLQQLLRYAQFLGRGSNLAAALCDVPFALDTVARPGSAPARSDPARTPAAAAQAAHREH